MPSSGGGGRRGFMACWRGKGMMGGMVSDIRERGGGVELG